MLALHLPDADSLTGQEIGALFELKPAAMLVLVYAAWDSDKGVSQQVTDTVLALKHDRLYVRFHADPNPPAFAATGGGAAAWGRLCARRMTQYYGGLEASGVRLHAILANEVDADYEGWLDPGQASAFYEGALIAYGAERPQDVLHVPAPTGAPETHREYLRRYKSDGWLAPAAGAWRIVDESGNPYPYDVVIDGHGYGPDFENVVNAIREECPGARVVITETNDLDDFRWPISLIEHGRVEDVVYFILNWARGGEGRVQPPTPDDAAKRMSLLRFPDRYAQFKATVTGSEPQPEPEPSPPTEEPVPEPVSEFPLPVDDDGNEWQASAADVLAAIREVAPQEIDPNDPARAILLLTALGIAESGADFQNQERWHIWTGHGKEAVRQRNLGYAAQVLGWGRDVGPIGTNDYSAGPFHPAWAWWDEFPGDPNDPNDPHRWDVLGWLRFRKRLIQDHGYATRLAARRLAPYYRQRPHDLQWVLERYNRPNGEVTSGVRANYARALALAPTVLGTAPAGPSPEPAPPSDVRFETYTDPSPAGSFASMPRGVILHGSRSGRASNTLAAEYAGTASYEVTNAAGLGWNATVGDRVVAVHLPATRWGWNARAASRNYLAVEFAQPTVANEITDGQVEAFARWFVGYVLPVWPGIPLFFPTHAEVEHSGETGIRDGKDDVFPYGDWRTDALRERIVTAIGRLTGQAPAPVPEPDPVVPETDAEKVARMVSALGYVGGDLMDRLEEIRAALDDDVTDRPSSSLTKADALASLAGLWRNVDAAYAEIGALISEVRRVRDEQLR